MILIWFESKMLFCQALEGQLENSCVWLFQNKYLFRIKIYLDLTVNRQSWIPVRVSDCSCVWDNCKLLKGTVFEWR